MLDLWRAQVPHGWVTGDDELGRHTQFRGSYANGTSSMSWECLAPPQFVIWRYRYKLRQDILALPRFW